ncbi:MAG: phosphotransferase family protein [Maricaulaceae bacterium]
MSSKNETVEIREGEALDIAAIDPVLKAHITGLTGTPVVTQYPSGASNLTYAVDYPDRRLVLRRPPFGTRPKSGHDMHREYRIMTALKPNYSVPETLYYTDDESVIGAEFYVMERSEGHLIHTKIPKEWDWKAADARALCEEFFTKLVDLHMTDYKAIGLEDFGRPEGYVARQIGGWNKRFEKAWTVDVDKFEDVRTWLDDNKPATERGAAILHGDYRIDNCILNLKDPRKIDAVLDWEISALGDPMMDLGNTLSYWVQKGDPEFMQLTVRQPSQADGMMTRQEILDFYAERTGQDVSNFQFYYVYGIWRLAVIIQQIYYRYYHGQTKDKRFATYGQMATALGEFARMKIKTGTL